MRERIYPEDNKYVMALEQARQSTERQRIEHATRDQWWLNLYDTDGQAGLMEEEHILNPLGELRSRTSIRNRAAGIFSRPHGQPPAPGQIRMTATDTFGSDVERDALVGLVESALDALYEQIKFTEKQKHTLRLVVEAHETSETASTYIAQKEGIHRQSAWERLQRIKAKTLTFDTKHVIVGSNQVVKQCVVCGKQLDTRTPHNLCWQHHRLHTENRYAQEQTPLTFDAVERLLREAKAS